MDEEKSLNFKIHDDSNPKLIPASERVYKFLEQNR